MRRAALVGITLLAVACGGEADDAGGATDGVAGTDQPSEADVDLRDELRDALAAAGDDAADELDAPTLEVAELDVDALTTWRIVRVVGYLDEGAREILWHYGLGPDGEVVALHGDPDAFATVTSADEVDVATPASAEQLALTYLEVTRPTDTVGEVVEDVADLPFLTALAPSEERRRDEVLADLADVVAPPATTATDGGYEVVVHWRQGTELLERTVTVDADGQVTVADEVLADDLPIPPGGTG